MSNTDQGITFRQCQTEEEKKKAYQLVKESYERGGLITPGTREIFTSRPDLTTIIALQDGEIIGTVSSARDTGPGSLPVDILFVDAVNTLRKDGNKLTENTCLATKKGVPISLILGLTRAALHHEMKISTDYVLGDVAPNHLKLYTDFMLFDQLAEKQRYQNAGSGDDWASGTWWIPIALDLRDYEVYRQRLKTKVPRAYKFYFGEET